MKRAFTCAFIIVIAATGCKKKEEPKKTTNTSTTTTTTTGGSTTGGTTTGGTNTNVTSFNGALTAMETVASIFGATFSIGSGQAWFSASPTASITSGAATTVTSVHLNGSELEPDSLGLYYSSDLIDVSTVTWSVTGNATIPSFTVSDTQGKPTTINASSLPSTISLGSPLNINLGTLANFRIGTFLLTDGSSNLGGTRIVSLAPGAGNVSFTAQDLAGLTPTQQGVILVVLENFQVVNINGKYFRLSRQSIVSQQVTIE